MLEKGKYYEFDEAVALVKKMATSKFDETIELHIQVWALTHVTQTSR